MSAKRVSIAKTSAPRLFGVVARDRLFTILDENRGRPLIWIEAPPGAGKTTLVASYLEARGIPTLWYQVDSADTDPANLFHYLAAAAATLLDAQPLALPQLAAEHLSDLPAFSRTYFRELFGRLPAGAAIVLDNYQEVAAAAPLHGVVRAAVGSVPPGGSIVGISRFEAPMLFSQLVAQAMLVTLRWEALQLTLEETRAIASMRDVRADWLVRALHQQSGGWPAGITLMLERVRNIDNDRGVLPADTREAVFDYFASLLFDQVSEATRQTLLCVAFMPHVTVSMAERLSGRREAGQVLDDLYRRHLFTDRRPGIEPVFQFHALFSDFLRKRTLEALGTDAARDLMVRSAEVLDASGDVEAGMELRLVIQDWARSEQVILDTATALLKSGRWQTLERWILALPDSVRERNPKLLYWLGMSQLQTQPKHGLATLLRARDALGRSADREGKVLCLAALTHAAQTGFAALAMADEWLGELLEEVEAVRPTLSPEAELPVWSAIASAAFYLRPWHPLAQLARERVQGLLQNESDPTIALMTAATTLYTDTDAGALELGEELVSLIEPLTNRREASASARAWFLFAVAHLRFLQARYEQSLDYFELARQAASASGLQQTLSDIILNRVMVEYRVCGWPAANATLHEFEVRPKPRHPYWLGVLRSYQARRAIFYGRLKEAADLAMASQEAINRMGSAQLEMEYGVFDADILAGANQTTDARAILARSREILDRSPILDAWCAAVTLTEAFVAHAEGNRDASLTMLRTALTAASVGSRRYFLRYLESGMPPMFCLALEEGIEVNLVQQLIRLFRLKPPKHAPDLWPRPVRIWTLGRFLVEVNEQPLGYSRKVPKKTLALLKALIAHGGEAVPEQWLCDRLWGDEEGDAARQVLGVTIARLRKLICNDDAVVQQGGRIWLDRQLCWVDVWRFEGLLDGQAHPLALREALKLYLGVFLPEDEGEPWSVAMRERLRGKFIHTLASCGQTLEMQGNTEEAIRLYQRGIDADVVVETFHRGLMRCYRSAGRLTEAVSAYRRLRHTLSIVLSVRPSAESEVLYREIVSKIADGPVQSQTTHL